MPSEFGAGRYHALDPDTYFWAHATFVDQVLYFADTFVKRLTPDEKDQIYLESKTWYRRYGVPDRTMRANYRVFERYLGPDDERDRRRTPDRRVRRRLCDQGFPVPEGRLACAVARHRARVRSGGCVPDDRRPATAGPRASRPS